MKYKKPLVSVLMPVYNAARYLGESLNSLAMQTLQDFEVIAVDDGSTDSSVKILESWGKMDERFHIIHKEHAGIVSTLTTGLEACSAPLVARMDADDLCHPERLERQADFLEQVPQTGLVSCRVNGFSETRLGEGFKIYLEWQNSLITDEDIRREMFVESPITHPSVMFRKECILAAGGYQERGLPEDYDLFLRLYLQDVKFEKLPEVLLEWRDGPKRLTRVDNRYSLENFLRLKAQYLKLGPLKDRSSIFIWGAGMMGRRLSKHLLREGVPLIAFIDVDPRKIGGRKRGLPILSPEYLTESWNQAEKPALLAVVGARGARPLIRQHLQQEKFVEGVDWWFAA